jgi:hypothetical protein
VSRQCSVTKRDGTRCNLPATGQQGTCWAHDERNAAQRRKTASRGGKGKANAPVKELRQQLDEIITRVLDGELVPYRGAVACQLLNAKIRLLELERKAQEQQVDAERLERLERLERRARTGGVWGA